MKADDLGKAATLYARLRAMRAVASRVADGEALSVSIGTGANQAGVALSAEAQQQLRARIAAELRTDIGLVTEELDQMGVET